MVDINEMVPLNRKTNRYFEQRPQRPVNTGLTLRNELPGFYVAEVELKNADRAKYGQKPLKEISRRANHHPGMPKRNLYLFQSFYPFDPQFLLSVTLKSYPGVFHNFDILPSSNARYSTRQNIRTDKACIPLPGPGLPIDEPASHADILITPLGSMHIIGSLKAYPQFKRIFYEMEDIKQGGQPSR